MDKKSIEYNLGKIWNTWLVAEYNQERMNFMIDLTSESKQSWFKRYDQDFNIEEFLMEFETQMSQSQIDFANHLLQVFVELDNHDNIYPDIAR